MEISRWAEKCKKLLSPTTKKPSELKTWRDSRINRENQGRGD